MDLKQLRKEFKALNIQSQNLMVRADAELEALKQFRDEMADFRRKLKIDFLISVARRRHPGCDIYPRHNHTWVESYSDDGETQRMEYHIALDERTAHEVAIYKGELV